jgi:hypothetical protein
MAGQDDQQKKHREALGRATPEDRAKFEAARRLIGQAPAVEATHETGETFAAKHTPTGRTQLGGYDGRARSRHLGENRPQQAAPAPPSGNRQQAGPNAGQPVNAAYVDQVRASVARYADKQPAPSPQKTRDREKGIEPGE